MRHGLRGRSPARRRLRDGQELPALPARAAAESPPATSRPRCWRAPPAARRARAELLVADMRDLPELGTFDLVTCIDEPLNYLTAGELETAFASAAARLAPERALPVRPQHAAHLPHGLRLHELPRGERALLRAGRPRRPRPRPRRRGAHDHRDLRPRRRRLLAAAHQPPRAAPSPAPAGARRVGGGGASSASPCWASTPMGDSSRGSTRAATPRRCSSHAPHRKNRRGGERMLKIETLERPVVPVSDYTKGA